LVDPDLSIAWEKQLRSSRMRAKLLKRIDRSESAHWQPPGTSGVATNYVERGVIAKLKAGNLEAYMRDHLEDVWNQPNYRSCLRKLS
jgi:hypothetical protein